MVVKEGAAQVPLLPLLLIPPAAAGAVVACLCSSCCLVVRGCLPAALVGDTALLL
jgi:hypothetical protein